MMQIRTRQSDSACTKATPLAPKFLSRLPGGCISARSAHRFLGTSSQQNPSDGPLQAKLAVGPAHDDYEQEADRMAERVVNAPKSQVSTLSDFQNSLTVQRKCPCGGSGDDCTCGTTAPLQRSAEGGSTLAVAPPIVHQVLRSPGQPLRPEIRAYMEPRFGRDFSRVRVHYDALAAESAQAVQARAYTVGSEIAFATGQFCPQSRAGLRLLAHELTHVVQQNSVATAPRKSAVESGSRNDAYERDADRVAASFDAESDLAAPHSLITAFISRPRLSRDWNSCADPPTCPAREPGELTRAASASLQVAALDAPETGEIVYSFGVGSSSVASLKSNPDWMAFVSFLSGSGDHWEILGFTDCEGATEGNTSLRQSRADAVRAALPGPVQVLIDRAVGASLSDCVAANDTAANRGFNRSVVFRRTSSTITMTDENITVTPQPLTIPTQDCTTGNNSEIAFALPIARDMVSHATDVLNHPSSSVDALLDKYFNDHSTSTYMHALAGFRNLASISGSFTIECEQPGSFMYNHFCGGSYAYVRDLVPGAHVHLCGSAFGRSANSLAETIVHESSHKFDNTGDHEYCWSGCPSTLSRWSAYDNADSFSKFARDAYLTIP